MSAAMFQRRASPLKGWGLTGSPGKERHRAAMYCRNQVRFNQPKWTDDTDVITAQYSVQQAVMLQKMLRPYYSPLWTSCGLTLEEQADLL